MSRANVRAFHENPGTHIYQPLKRISQNSRVLLSSAEIFEAYSTNSIDPDQTAPIVWPGSTLFASILMFTNKQTFSDVVYFAGVLRVK